MKQFHDDHYNREAVVAELATLYGFGHDIPRVRKMLAFFSYREIVKPLVIFHRKKSEPYSKIAMKYKISIEAVKYICRKGQ